MSVCPACKGNSHLNGKPKHCPGVTWCDCQHRLTVDVTVGQDVLLKQQGFVLIDDDGGSLETNSNNIEINS